MKPNVIPATEARCRPSQPCAMKHRCARFQAENVPGAILSTVGCPGYLAPTFGKPAEERKVKPWIGEK